MTILGELVGFGLVGALAVALFGGEEPGFATTVVFSLLAALLEGGVLAFAQWRVLRRSLEVGYAPWAWGTIWPAAIAYLVGMLAGPRLWDLGLSMATIAFVAVGMLLGIGALLGFGQWLVLRRLARGASWWVPCSALGWAGGVALAVVGVSLASDAGATWVLVGGSVASGVAMGAFVGLVTGVAFARIEPARSSSA